MLLDVMPAVVEFGPSGSLPRRLSTFVGRELERVEVAARLGETRLLTLTGVGGCGKTSLALQLARQVGAGFPGGVFWVELAPLADPGEVAVALARSVGVRPLPGQSDLRAAVGFLAERRALVVVDNCEHVIERSAEVVEALLVGCGEASVLATSRVPLRLPGEAEWRVPSLGLPTGSGVGVDVALDSDAVRLFVDRARLVRAGFLLDESTVGPVVEICRRLDGIPLAIELAAGRLRLLSVGQIARGLDDALGLVAGSARTALPRHRTLRASLEWSYELLDPIQQLLFRRLGVLVSGFTLPLAEAVAVDARLPADRMLDVLGSLVEHSLVQVIQEAATSRYRLLEAVRQYALERLEQTGELAAARDRHLAAVLALAERQRDEVGGPRMAEAIATIDAAAANALSAIDHAVATSPERAQRLAIALFPWFRARGRLREGGSACEAALAADPAPSSLRAGVMSTYAHLLGIQGDFDRAIAMAGEAREIAEALGDEATMLKALVTAASFQALADPTAAAEPLERCLELGLRRRDDWVVARSAMPLANVAFWQQDAKACDAYVDAHRRRIEAVGDRWTLAGVLTAQGGSRYATLEHRGAAELLGEAIAAAREIGDPVSEGAPRVLLALIRISAGEAGAALDEVRRVRERLLVQGHFYYLPWVVLVEALARAACGDLPAAATALESVITGKRGSARAPIVWARIELAEVLRLLGESDASRVQATRGLEAAQALGNPWYEAKGRLTLGRLSAVREEWRAAERLHHEALAAIAARGLRLELPSALEALAEAAVGVRSHEQAARLLGAAERGRHEGGPVPWPSQDAERRALGHKLREALGDQAFARAFREGAAMTDDEVVAWIRRTRGPRARPAAGWDSLTPAELEVVRHASAGLTNPEIGERLFIARATVKAHLAHVYAKLGVTNRTELATLAARRAREQSAPVAE